ncbi:hypothetical protein VSK91_19625 [Bacillus swezeyi]|uniref:hypothetical protein n=1 Tax=Bacillus swezeyi TaxID=1925020 RepID=UPI0039C5D7D8
MEQKYRVIKDIAEGWETGAAVGDVLTVKPWQGELTLMKDDKAVCDTDSEYAKDYCEEIE